MSLIARGALKEPSRRIHAIELPAPRQATTAEIPWGILAVVCMGILMIMVDTTIVNIAVPSIISGLRASLDEVLWAINAYLLVYAVLLVPAGRLGDLYGPRTVFVLGLVTFTLASAICGFAQNPAQLIAARAVQGAGAGLLMPQALALITTATPEARRGFALGVFAGVTALAAIAGPLVGGYIITSWSWHWIFEINVPIGVAAVLASVAVLPRTRPGTRRALDPVGMVLVSTGLLGVVFGLLEGQRYSWASVVGPITIPEILAAGASLLALFVWWEVRHSGGLLPIALLSRRNYAVGNLIGALVGFAMLGLLLSVVLFCQVVLGLSALATGYALMPAFLGLLAGAPIGGRLADRIGGRYPLFAGGLLSTFGFALVIRAAAVSASATDMVFPLGVIGLGNGLAMAPLFSMVMAGIPEALVGAASGIVSASRPLGQALGTAVIGGVLQNRLAIAMHDQAVIFAAQLPPASREHFVGALSAATGGGSSGLGVMPTGAGGDLLRLAHEVVAHAYVEAMIPTAFVALIVMGVATASSLAMSNRRAGKPVILGATGKMSSSR